MRSGFQTTIKICINLLLFSLLPALLWSEPVSVTELLDRTGSRLLWEPVTKKGILISGQKSVTFSTDYPVMVLDNKTTVYSGSILYDKGRLTFSEDAAAVIEEHLNGREHPGSSDRFRIAGILIDPGHGGRDSGAVSRFPVDGVTVPFQEKFLVLEISLRLAELLKANYPEKEILLTRATDVYPTLENRVRQANDFPLKEGEGIIYISIHGNASLNSRAKGFEVWYLPENFRRQVLDGSDGNEGLLPVLNTLMEEEFTLESRKLAGTILEHLEKKVGETTENRGLKEESWFVVRNAMMASVLIETGFITNREETEKLREPEYLHKITEGIYNGVIDFVNFFER